MPWCLVQSLDEEELLREMLGPYAATPERAPEAGASACPVPLALLPSIFFLLKKKTSYSIIGYSSQCNLYWHYFFDSLK